MAHDDQFTATGPSFTGSGFSRAAFSTNRFRSDFGHGVNVEGSRCGVFGQSVQQATSSRESDVDGVGVFGKGDYFGIFGQGNYGLTGVIGIHNNIQRPNRDGVGVIGVTMRGGTGIIGASLRSLTALIGQKQIPTSADGSGTGVFGASGSGTGVRGTSATGSGGAFESEDGSGISGNSDSGVGVEARSQSGAGLNASSAEDRGAVFESGTNVAQMRLVAQRQRSRYPRLPKKGKVGDLLLIRYPGISPVINAAPVDVCSLWLCIPPDKRGSGQSPDDSNRWQEVVLGQVVLGSL